MNHRLSTSSIYSYPWHRPCLIYVLGTLILYCSKTCYWLRREAASLMSVCSTDSLLSVCTVTDAARF